MNTILCVAVIALVTALLRVLPYWVFRRGTPAWVSYLGKVLPGAIMAVLVVYCLRNTRVTAFPWGLPELAGTVVTVLLHLWKRNTLLSIIMGTGVYMALCAVL